MTADHPMTLPMTLQDLATPALLLDRTRLTANCARMARRMTEAGIDLRPHLKTAKSAEVAKLACAGHFGGVTVSTLREARYFLEAGIADITYAVGIVPAKFAPAFDLTARGARLSVLLDSLPVARALVDYAASRQETLAALIEIDSGGARAGLLPDAVELLEIAAALQGSKGIAFCGLLTHAGHSYHAQSIEEVRRIARQERDGIVRAAERLRAAGFACPVVSAGSTPTATHGDDFSGLTEMRPGVYVFQDLDQVALGSCGLEDIALSVLTSVIGHNRHCGHLLLDAGGLALSKDISATEFDPATGYGLLTDLEGQLLSPQLAVRDVHQEHGIVPLPDPALFDRFPSGSKLRVLPNHACMTGAAYDAYNVHETDKVTARWDRVNGW